MLLMAVSYKDAECPHFLFSHDFPLTYPLEKRLKLIPEFST